MYQKDGNESDGNMSVGAKDDYVSSHPCSIKHALLPPSYNCLQSQAWNPDIERGYTPEPESMPEKAAVKEGKTRGSASSSGSDSSDSDSSEDDTDQKTEAAKPLTTSEKADQRPLTM